VSLDRARDEETPLARDVVLADPRLWGMTRDHDYVYWIGLIDIDGPNVARVWRTPLLFGGETEIVGDLDATPIESTLVVREDWLYFLATVSDDYPRLYKGKIHTPFEAVDDMSAPATELRADEESFFLALEGDVLGNGGAASGIGRADPMTFEVEMLFETEGHIPWHVALGDRHVYWVINEGNNADLEGAYSVWRGRKDGSGEPEELATLLAWPYALSVTGDSLYWLTQCQVGQVQHLIKAALP